jgi:hypothetical protein
MEKSMGARRVQYLPVADLAPATDILTSYDHNHLLTYLRLLDADDEGADWTEVVRGVLRLDPVREPVRSRRSWESHLARARWMVGRILRAETEQSRGSPV